MLKINQEIKGDAQNRYQKGQHCFGNQSTCELISRRSTRHFFSYLQGTSQCCYLACDFLSFQMLDQATTEHGNNYLHWKQTFYTAEVNYSTLKKALFTLHKEFYLKQSNKKAEFALKNYSLPINGQCLSHCLQLVVPFRYIKGVGGILLIDFSGEK